MNEIKSILFGAYYDNENGGYDLQCMTAENIVTCCESLKEAPKNIQELTTLWLQEEGNPFDGIAPTDYENEPVTYFECWVKDGLVIGVTEKKQSPFVVN